MTDIAETLPASKPARWSGRILSGLVIVFLIIDGAIKLHVNGKEVSGVSACRPRKGYLALESEGAECHFRNLRIKELPSTSPKPEETAEEAKGFSGKIHTRKLNVADEAEVGAFVDFAHEAMGGLNGLVNNAGILRDGLLVKRARDTGMVTKLSRADWQLAGFHSTSCESSSGCRPAGGSDRGCSIFATVYDCRPV